MAALLKSEREDARQFIQAQADRERERVESGNPKWEHEVKAKARKIAIGSFGIEAQLVQIGKLEAKIKALQDERDDLETVTRKKLPAKDSRYKDTCTEPMSICEAVNIASDIAFPAAMEKHPIGKKLNQIEKKKQSHIALLMKCSTREDISKSKCLDW